MDLEVICTPLALEADQNAAAEAFETIANAPGTSLLTHPDLPFTIGIIDDVVIVVGFDDGTNQPVVAATTDDPDAREWAEQLYQGYAREADPLDAL
jgi:predicted transcriptional regulator